MVRENDAERRARDPWRKWYKIKSWINLCIWKMNRNPLCERCVEACAKEGQGLPRAAEVVHHKIDHRGNWQLFIDPENLEALCKKCHDAIPKTHDGRMPQNDLAPVGESGKIFCTAVNPKALEQALHADDALLGDVDEIKIPY